MPLAVPSVINSPLLWPDHHNQIIALTKCNSCMQLRSSYVRAVLGMLLKLKSQFANGIKSYRSHVKVCYLGVIMCYYTTKALTRTPLKAWFSVIYKTNLYFSLTNACISAWLQHSSVKFMKMCTFSQQKPGNSWLLHNCAHRKGQRQFVYGILAVRHATPYTERCENLLK